MSHDHQTHPPHATIPQQCTTSHGPPKWIGAVQHLVFVMVVISCQCLSCFYLPKFQHSFREDGGRGGGGSTAANEWGYRDESWASW